MAKGSAILGKQEKVIIELIRHGHRDITWLELGPPNLWRDIDNKSRSGAMTNRGGRQHQG
jgi:hypothetical protein